MDDKLLTALILQPASEFCDRYISLRESRKRAELHAINFVRMYLLNTFPTNYCPRYKEVDDGFSGFRHKMIKIQNRVWQDWNRNTTGFKER